MECVVGLSDLMTEPGGVYHVQNIYRLLERGREGERRREKEGEREGEKDKSSIITQ